MIRFIRRIRYQRFIPQWIRRTIRYIGMEFLTVKDLREMYDGKLPDLLVGYSEEYKKLYRSRKTRSREDVR